MHGTQTQIAKLRTGEPIEVKATTRMTQAALWARGEVSIDGTMVFSQVWDLLLLTEVA